jgi:CheY-like chemotaxis protein
MNGGLTLSSEAGQGTTVTLSLELDVVSGAETETQLESGLDLPALPAGTPRGGERRRILVVDDNEFNRAVLARQVAALGYEAEQASDGEEALQLLDRHDYALILADCQMPGMDGFEFARAVRKTEAADSTRRRTPIVAWTANVMPDDVAACRDAGMDDVLAKPSALPDRAACAARLGRSRGRSVAGRARRQPAAAPANDGAPIDRMQLRAIMDGDAALEAEMLAGFRTASVKEAAALRDASCAATAAPSATRPTA